MKYAVQANTVRDKLHVHMRHLIISLVDIPRGAEERVIGRILQIGDYSRSSAEIWERREKIHNQV